MTHWEVIYRLVQFFALRRNGIRIQSKVSLLVVVEHVFAHSQRRETPRNGPGANDVSHYDS